MIIQQNDTQQKDAVYFAFNKIQREVDQLCKVADSLFDEIVLDNYTKYSRYTTIKTARVQSTLNILKQILQ